jgi:hypothetical protein
MTYRIIKGFYLSPNGYCLNREVTADNVKDGNLVSFKRSDAKTDRGKTDGFGQVEDNFLNLHTVRLTVLGDGIAKGGRGLLVIVS